MSQAVSISAIQVTLSDGTVLDFDSGELLPGAHYSTSRNFTRPPRKFVKGEPKQEQATWVHHEIHFSTDHEPMNAWQQRQDT